MGDYAHIRGHITLKEELVDVLTPRFLRKDEDEDLATWEDLDLPESIKLTDAFRFLVLCGYGDWMPGAMSSAIRGFFNSPYGEEAEAKSRLVLEGRGVDFYASFKQLNAQYAFVALLPHIAEDWHVEIDWHEFMWSYSDNPHAGWTEWDSSKSRDVSEAERAVSSAIMNLLSEQERTERVRLAAELAEPKLPNVGTVGHIDHGKRARGMTESVIMVDSLGFLPPVSKMDDGRVIIDTSHGWDYMGRPPAKGLTDAQRSKNKAKRKQQAKSRKKNRK